MGTTTHILATAVAFLLAGAPATHASAPSPADSARADSARAVASAPVDSASSPPEAILYYFHRTLRCEACLTMEAYIDEAVRAYFAEDLSRGRILFRPTDIEMPENFHLEEEFALEFNSAVLVRLAGGKVVSWSHLDQVWDLLEYKEEFVDYIRSSVADAMRQSTPAPGPGEESARTSVDGGGGAGPAGGSH